MVIRLMDDPANPCDPKEDTYCQDTLQTIPFTCSRPTEVAAVSEEVGEGGPEPAPRPAPAPPKPAPGAPREPYLVRATQNMVLQPREGCVIGPTLEVDPDDIHRSTTLVLDPDLPCNRIAFDGDRRCGFTQTKVQCSPTAMVTPRYIPEEDRVAVATTVINLGSEPLIIRQG